MEEENCFVIEETVGLHNSFLAIVCPVTKSMTNGYL